MKNRESRPIVDFSEETATEAVVQSLAQTPDPRLRSLLQSLVRHLHGFVREVELTPEEWGAAIEFLTATGKMCSETRQEFILLSDILGVSMLVDAIANRVSNGGTPSTVLGPFHMVESPRRELGDSIALQQGGEPCLVTGTVRSIDGKPLRGAEIDVWHANQEGFYDVQQPGVQPERNLRGLFRADGEGLFWFRTITPCHYPVPVDGPVGGIFRATKRFNERPAHIHFIAEAPGHRPLTTHVFVADSPCLDTDPVFGVKRSLVRDFERVDDPSRAAHFGLPNPFRQVTFDIVLVPKTDPR